PDLASAVQTLINCGVQNQVTMILTDAAYNEIAPIDFSAVSGLSPNNRVVFRPAPGVNPVTTIQSGVAGYGIRMDSVSYITLDGANTVGASTQNWTIKMAGSNPNGPVFLIRDGSQDSIKNLNLRNISMTSGYGIQVQPTRIKMSGTTIQNNDIRIA